MVHVIVIINPFDAARGRKDYYVPWDAKKPLCMYHSEKGEKVYAVNGVQASPTDTVQDGQEIVVAPMIRGGKFFKGLLGIGLIIAGAALGVGAWGTMTSMATGLRLGTAMALTMIGSHIVNKLTPQPKLDTSNTEQENTYGWGAPQTLTGQGYVLPVCYGTVKTAGLMLQRHVVSDGEKQYLNVLYCLGEGIIDNVADIKLNNNPIGNFTGVTTSIRNGSNQQAIIPEFNDSYADTALAYELKPSDWHTVTLDGNTAQGIEITLSFPQGLFTTNKKGNPDWTSVTINAQYRKKGATDWNDIPIRNENYEGEPDWAKKASGWRKYTTWREHYNAECRTLVGYKTYKSRGLTRYRYDENGERIPKYTYSMTYDEWKQKIKEEHMYEGVIRQKTNAAFYRVWGIHDLEPAQYEVRARMAARDKDDIRTANKCQWIGVTQVIYDDFCYPGKALLGLRALATDQLSGSDPQMTCIISRDTVEVWDPASNAYVEKPANNPAWVAYDMLHRCRKLLNADKTTYTYDVTGIAKENMDYYAFSAWADMCDKAGIEFNYLYDSAMKLWDALNYPCRVGRGSVIIVGTKVSCVYDYASDPVQLFTVANIKKDSFSNEYQSTEDRANEIEISFLNAEKNYERDVLTVYSDTYDDADTVVQPTQVELMGCTSLKQAFQYGKFKLRSNKYEVRTVQFDAFADAIACQIGDVITVQSDVTEWGLGGRIVAIDGNVLTLDQVVTEENSDFTNIIIRNNSTDQLMKQAVTNVKGNQVTVSSSAGVEVGCVYALGTKTKEAKNFKVLSISADLNEETRTITAVEYYPELYSLNLDDVPTIQTYDDEIEAPRNLTLTTESYTEADGTITSLIHCRWINPRNLNAVVMEVSRDGQNYSYETTFNSGENAYTFSALTLQTYYVRIYAVDDIGRRSDYAYNNIITNGEDSLPPDVETINVEKMASGLRRYWWQFEYPYPDDIAGFRIKYTQGKQLNWDNGIPVQEGLITTQPYETQTVRQGVHAVMIKAVDNAGNESPNFAYCVLDLGDLLEENVLLHTDFHKNNWKNVTHNGVLLSDGYIHARNDTMMWTSQNEYMWGGKDKYKWGANFLPYDLTATFIAEASGQLWLRYDISGPAIVYYRKNLSTPAWVSGEEDQPAWVDDEPLWDESGDMWKQYSDRVLVSKGDIIQVKVHALNNSEQETIVKELEALIDVPDRNEHFEDLAIPAEGRELPIVTPNYKTTAVHLDAIQGKAVNVKFLSRTPCVVQLLDSAGNAVAGTVDISWQGYEEDRL